MRSSGTPGFSTKMFDKDSSGDNPGPKKSRRSASDPDRVGAIGARKTVGICWGLHGEENKKSETGSSCDAQLRLVRTSHEGRRAKRGGPKPSSPPCTFVQRGRKASAPCNPDPISPSRPSLAPLRPSPRKLPPRIDSIFRVFPRPRARTGPPGLQRALPRIFSRQQRRFFFFSGARIAPLCAEGAMAHAKLRVYGFLRTRARARPRRRPCAPGRKPGKYTPVGKGGFRRGPRNPPFLEVYM